MSSELSYGPFISRKQAKEQGQIQVKLLPDTEFVIMFTHLPFFRDLLTGIHQTLLAPQGLHFLTPNLHFQGRPQAQFLGFHRGRRQ